MPLPIVSRLNPFQSCGISVPEDRSYSYQPLRLDFPAEHHRVVFMGQVMAMGDILTGKGPEVSIDRHGLTAFERDDVLPGTIIRMGCVRYGPLIAGDDLMFLHVAMDRMGPAAALIHKGPEFRLVTFDRGFHSGVIKGSSIDRPQRLPP